MSSKVVRCVPAQRNSFKNMCGIYGIVALHGELRAERSLLSRMGQAIRHRGPDDEGWYLDQDIALGMRRLSIIDLSGGHQPMSNEDQTVWAACNGEIYNFHFLREELKRQGHIFRSASDTEVIVHLYEQQGVGFVNKLRGMFGLALWDKRNRRLIIARDRVGEKPLYFYKDSQRLIFASEIKAILECESVPRRINPKALHHYCALGYVPAPLTMFDGIEKLLPGHVLIMEQGKVTIKPYWDFSFNAEEERSEEEWIELLRNQLIESVRAQLVSDVPLGAFLSGGIDSSAIVAAMAQSTGRQVNTYSIGFEGADGFYDELPYARLVAKAYSTNHHEIVVRPDVCTLLPELIWHLDEPVADSAMITTYLVARLARESVTVILSGVGGDELFGGYRRYLGESIDRHYKRLPGVVRHKILPWLFSNLPQDRHAPLANYARLAHSYIASANQEVARGYEDFISVFSPAMRADLLLDHRQHESSPIQEYSRRCRSANSLHRNMYVDIKTSLADDLLLLTDKMTMAASIECRAPFLDHELIELTARMPARFKVNGFALKYLLKKAVAPWLPREILHRKKRGFGAPVGSWFRKQLQPLVDDCLSSEQIKRRGFFNPATVRQIIDSHHHRKADHTDHLLALISFEIWCRTFLDAAKPSATDSQVREGALRG